MDEVKYMYYCVTSVDFFCPVPLSRIVDTSSEVQGDTEDWCDSIIVLFKIFYLFPDHIGVKEHYLFIVRGCYRC